MPAGAATGPRPPTHLVFVGDRLAAAGDLITVARACRRHAESDSAVLVFEVASGRQVDLDVSGAPADLEARYAAASEPAAAGEPPPGPRRRGRPRLGVVGREVTLLPRHWEWLDRQRGGASAALRRLVEQARRDGREDDRVREAQDRTNRFLAALAGNRPGFEAATRALYARDGAGFRAQVAPWPGDIRHWALALARDAFEDAR